jgi:hypothetical protein
MSQIYVERIRQHSAGSFGGTVSGATNATPIVITTAAAHGLIDGDQVQATGVGGNPNANTLAYVKGRGVPSAEQGLILSGTAPVSLS